MLGLAAARIGVGSADRRTNAWTEELKLWIGGAVLTMVLAVVGTGVAVSGNMNAQISDVRADIRQIPDSVDRLDRRLDDVEKGITGMQVKIDLLMPEPAAD